MRHNHLKIRVWLALAVAIASLGFASSASARLVLDDGSSLPTVTPPAPVVVTTTDGFSWGDALVGAGVALAAALGGIGIAYVARNRTRLAT